MVAGGNGTSAEGVAGAAPAPDTPALLAALRFAAEKHKGQPRKGRDAAPYINHPIAVAEILARYGCGGNLALLQAAILHDTIEDTDTTGPELEGAFGPAVRRLVEEVSDDKRLPKQERKRLQVEHAPHLSPEARQLKFADLICNVRDITHDPPEDWPDERRRAYLHWARQVAEGCRGVNPALEAELDAALAEGESVLREG